MKILHITNDYSGSKVYMNLFQELDKIGVSQIIYHPVKDSKNINKNKITFHNNDSRIIYSKSINKSTDRLIYRIKIRKIFLDIENKVDLSKIDFIHAHTWYSDGGVAYLLSKKYNIPYILAVRSSDVNVFYKYLIFERNFGKKILNESKKIVLISKAYKNRLPEIVSLQNKIEIIPNGVDSFWIENTIQKKNLFEPEILYVGSFINRKHVANLILAILLLEEKGYNVVLNLIGGGGSEQKKIEELIKLHPETIKYHGVISDKELLKDHYQRNYIFAMPSKNETFGLVYIEALLQGLPVLYTSGEGIDGYFDNKIGEKVDSFDKFEIANKIENMINNYNIYDFDTKTISIQHNWQYIAKKYIEIYNHYSLNK